MAQVPYQPYPTAQPTSPGEQVSVSTPGAVFGENIGAALRQAGGTVEHVGDELFQRAIALQDLANETAARTAASDYVEKQGMMQADFDSLKGKDAKDRLPQHLKDSEDLRLAARNSLTAPMAQKMFDGYTFNFKDRIVFSSARHAGDEFKNYTVNEALASADTIRKTWINPTDPKERDHKIEVGNDALDTVAAAQGWGPNKIADERLKWKSGVIAEQANSLARQGKTEAGMTLLKDAQEQGTITEQDYNTAYDHVSSRDATLGAKSFVNKNYDPSQTKMDKAIEAEAIRRHPDNDDLQTKFENAAKSEYRLRAHYDYAREQQQFREHRTAIYTAVNSDEVTDMASMENHPAAGPAYAAMSPEEKLKIQKDLPNVVANHYKDREQQSYNYLNRLAQTSPNDFLSVDLWDPSLHLNKQDMNHFIAERARLIKGPFEDPMLRRAIGLMRDRFPSELKEAKVFYAPTKNQKNPAYDNYITSLSEGIQSYIEAKGHPPTSPQEFIDQIGKPTLAKHSEPAWFGFSTQDVPEFMRTIPADVLKKAQTQLQEEAKAAGGAAPSPQQVQRYIMHEQWKQFYQGKGTTEGGPAKAGGTGAANIPD